MVVCGSVCHIREAVVVMAVRAIWSLHWIKAVMEEWSDVTALIADRPVTGLPTSEDEITQQDPISNLN